MGSGLNIRSFQPCFEIIVARFQRVDLVLEGFVLSSLFFALGHEEGDFLVEGADVGFGFVVFDVAHFCVGCVRCVVDWRFG